MDWLESCDDAASAAGSDSSLPSFDIEMFTEMTASPSHKRDAKVTISSLVNSTSLYALAMAAESGSDVAGLLLCVLLKRTLPLRHCPAAVSMLQQLCLSDAVAVSTKAQARSLLLAVLAANDSMREELLDLWVCQASCLSSLPALTPPSSSSMNGLHDRNPLLTGPGGLYSTTSEASGMLAGAPGVPRDVELRPRVPSTVAVQPSTWRCCSLMLWARCPGLRDVIQRLWEDRDGITHDHGAAGGGNGHALELEVDASPGALACLVRFSSCGHFVPPVTLSDTLELFKIASDLSMPELGRVATKALLAHTEVNGRHVHSEEAAQRCVAYAARHDLPQLRQACVSVAREWRRQGHDRDSVNSHDAALRAQVYQSLLDVEQITSQPKPSVFASAQRDIVPSMSPGSSPLKVPSADDDGGAAGMGVLPGAMNKVAFKPGKRTSSASSASLAPFAAPTPAAPLLPSSSPVHAQMQLLPPGGSDAPWPEAEEYVPPEAPRLRQRPPLKPHSSPGSSPSRSQGGERLGHSRGPQRAAPKPPQSGGIYSLLLKETGGGGGGGVGGLSSLAGGSSPLVNDDWAISEAQRDFAVPDDSPDEGMSPLDLDYGHAPPCSNGAMLHQPHPLPVSPDSYTSSSPGSVAPLEWVVAAGKERGVAVPSTGEGVFEFVEDLSMAPTQKKTERQLRLEEMSRPKGAGVHAHTKRAVPPTLAMTASAQHSAGSHAALPVARESTSQDTLVSSSSPEAVLKAQFHFAGGGGGDGADDEQARNESDCPPPSSHRAPKSALKLLKAKKKTWHTVATPPPAPAAGSKVAGTGADVTPHGGGSPTSTPAAPAPTPTPAAAVPPSPAPASTRSSGPLRTPGPALAPARTPAPSRARSRVSAGVGPSLTAAVGTTAAAPSASEDARASGIPQPKWKRESEAFREAMRGARGLS